MGRKLNQKHIVNISIFVFFGIKLIHSKQKLFSKLGTLSAQF